MLRREVLFLVALGALSLRSPCLVDGHGYLKTPRSRNWYAHENARTDECPGSAGCPPAEYCPHCLNANAGVCGTSLAGRGYDAGAWLGKNGAPVPWRSQGTYGEGALLRVESYLDINKSGYMELHACVVDAAAPASCAAPADFAEHELVFVRDLGHATPFPDPSKSGMPPDPHHPTRGAYAGGRGSGSGRTFVHEYRLPPELRGERVLLRWRYVTADSCSPPGYAEYFAAHPDLPASYWTPGLPECTPPYPEDGARGPTWPEQFFNCAEISILPLGQTSPPSISPVPTPPPVTTRPTVSAFPVDVASSCLVRWQDCTYDWQNCCEGYKCTQVDSSGYGRCLEDTTCDWSLLPAGGPSISPSESSSPTKTSAPGPTGFPTIKKGSDFPSLNPTGSPSTPTPTESSDFPSASPTGSPSTSAPVESPTDYPSNEPTTRAPQVSGFPSVYSNQVRVNQVGYLRLATKVGIIVDDSTEPIQWQIQDAVGSVVLGGSTAVYGLDGASGDFLHHADFSPLSDLGTYKLVADSIGGSLEFHITPTLYPDLPHEAMNYFYFHRLGTVIEGRHLVDDRYARAALHPDDTSVPPYPGWCSTCDRFNVSGSWADAGDFGVYTVNHAISAWTLLNLLEMFPMAFKDGDLNLPESNNTYPDLLDEVDFGSRFIRGMLPSNGGLASHKVHNHAWSTFVITVEDENESNAAGTRSAMGSSTPATYAVARVNAQLARVWSANGGDEGHITNLWNAAKDAWTRADGTTKVYDATEASPGPAIGGGDYHDSEINDDRYAAACEMYLTAYALGDGDAGAYKTAVMGSRFFTQMSQWDWATVAGAGTLSLYAVDNDLSLPIQTRIITNILTFADKIKSAIDSEGYPSNLEFSSDFSKYPWGSNSFIMNRMITLAYAYEITGNVTYQKYLLRSMDYVMGTNAMDISYITGYGAKAETDTHDRWAWTVSQNNFWPRGWLSGGPNNEYISDYETPAGVAAAKSYAGPGTAPHAFSSKENTINWNAPLAWTAWYIENKVVPNLGSTSTLSNQPSSMPTVRPNTFDPTPNPHPKPSNQPSSMPTGRPTFHPTGQPSEMLCCANRYAGYQECIAATWCNENADQCGLCGGVIMSVPLERTGCCSLDGQDCSAINPTADFGCQYIQSDCEESCNGSWQLFGRKMAKNSKNTRRRKRRN